MGANTKIEWCDHTFNPWRGCTKVSAGCANCYAAAMAKRNPSVLGEWGANGARVVGSDDYWDKPLQWDAAAAQRGQRARVFCGSMMDVFEGAETLPDEGWRGVVASRARLWELIDDTPHLDWLLLTKRPQNTLHMLPVRWLDAMPDNVWIGTSVENQDAADERIPHLLRIPARVRFLSCEPLLGAVDLSAWLAPDVVDVSGMSLEEFRAARQAQRERVAARPRLHWIIVGGESGAKARPMHPQWVRSLRDQAVAAGVPFFFKQWGEYAPLNADTPMPARKTATLLRGRDDTLTWAWRAGKHAAGRLLDGREWDEQPEGA